MKNEEQLLKTREDLKFYMEQDSLSYHWSGPAPKARIIRVLRGPVWNYRRMLRHLKYHINNRHYLRARLFREITTRFSRKNGFVIPPNVFGPGLCLCHGNAIVVSEKANIGKNCRIHQGVTTGDDFTKKGGALIGDNVLIGANAAIIGPVKIANNVAIGAGSVVVKDILESNTTWVGNPARKVNNKGSKGQLSIHLCEDGIMRG